jgi:heat shock protein HslJ
MKPSCLLSLVALAALALAACGGDDAASTPVPDPQPPATAPPTTTEPAVEPAAELEGRQFLSASVEGYDLVDDTVIRLSFDVDSLSANAGCNTLFGGYTISEGRLQVQQLATTEMACETDLMVQDRWLTDILSLEPFVELDGDTLTMRGAGGATLEFVDRTVADPDRPITETRWVLDGIRDGDAVSTVPEGVTAAITFLDDGTAVVEAGCNRGSAGVEITDDTIVFGPIALTRMMCEPGAMDVEATVTALLDGEVSYTIVADRLMLDSADTVTGDADDTSDEPVEMGGIGLMFVADDDPETT